MGKNSSEKKEKERLNHSWTVATEYLITQLFSTFETHKYQFPTELS
jgi:hypothetical protein